VQAFIESTPLDYIRSKEQNQWDDLSIRGILFEANNKANRLAESHTAKSLTAI
jgi:hypothetical protein